MHNQKYSLEGMLQRSAIMNVFNVERCIYIHKAYNKCIYNIHKAKKRKVMSLKAEQIT